MEINKKLIFISLGLVAMVVISAALYQFVFKKEEAKLVSPLVPVGEPAEVLAPSVTWEDPAGFSFDYPGDLDTNSHEEDEENYAHLELTDIDHSGGIIIWMKDTKLKDIEDWESEGLELLRGSLTDTQLGGHPAKKADFVDGRVIIVALDQEVIVLAEMLSGDTSFWQPIYDQIVSSFKFIPLPTKMPKPQTGGTNEIWEEEEVVE